MRIASLILLLALCGCVRGSSGPGPSQMIRKGGDRLVMKYLPAAPLPDGRSVGYDFDSLVWESKDGDVWRKRAVITQEHFEAGTDRRRWVSELHSFDPSTGNAIIKVGEGDAPKDSMRVHINYSWREWNLRTNGEVRVIRACTDPFEKY